MSCSVDVNVLLYASDKSNPRHQKAVEFLKERSSDSELFCIAWITLMSYLRISTHPGEKISKASNKAIGQKKICAFDRRDRTQKRPGIRSNAGAALERAIHIHGAIQLKIGGQHYGFWVFP